MVGNIVFLSTIPSFPKKPTVAEAATTLWIAIMLPAAAPTAWSATIIKEGISNLAATPNWKIDNIRLLTVLLPAINAPNAPMVGANRGYMAPALPATHSAMAMGIPGRPAGFAPELI